METFEPLVTFLAHVVGLIGGAIIVTGVSRATFELVRIGIDHLRKRNRGVDRRALRQNLGYAILLGLEFLIAADVLLTIIHPDVQTLISLGAVVLIRTLISTTLNWELLLAERTGASHSEGGEKTGGGEKGTTSVDQGNDRLAEGSAGSQG